MITNLTTRFRKHTFQDLQIAKSYDQGLSSLFEKAAWAIVTWAFFLNLISPVSSINKKYTYLLLLMAVVFNLGYFRFLYWKLNKKKYRYYLPETVFGVLIWFFLHLHLEFAPYILLPYYIVILATSLTLRRFDSLLVLVTTLLFTFIETIVLKKPLSVEGLEIGLVGLGSLVIFSWAAINLADFIHSRDLETDELLKETDKENEKSHILRRYALDLIMDKNRAEILMNESTRPVIVIDYERKILEVNPKFKELSDFKNVSLTGKNIDYVLKIENGLDLNQDSYLPQDFGGLLTSRRNKTKKVLGKAHFLLGQDGRVKQVLLLLT